MEQYLFMLERGMGLITADWIVLWGLSLGGWWIPIRKDDSIFR